MFALLLCSTSLLTASPQADLRRVEPQAAAASMDNLPVFVELQRAQSGLETILNRLEPKATMIRTDSTLDAETRSQRLNGLLTPYRNEILAFEAAVVATVRFQMIAEGETPENAEGAAETMSHHLASSMLSDFVNGKRAEP